MSTLEKPVCSDNRSRHQWPDGTRNDHNGALWLRQVCLHCKVARFSGGFSYCGRPNGRTFYEVPQ